MMAHKTPLKPFQKKAVDHAYSILSKCMDLIVKGTANNRQNRLTAVSNYGHVLFEAPTGIGKTLMVGTACYVPPYRHHFMPTYLS